MKNKILRTLSLLLLLLAVKFSPGQSIAVTSKNAMASFMDKRFGMFIHWGPVTLRGTEIGWSRGEQVPEADYDSLYKEFNPVLFNANAWVKSAKDAGMKYLTITAKHHDGFCLWPTKFSDYNIMKTPYKRDIVGELAAACKKQGVTFCIYFTVLDWHDKDYPIHRMKDTTQGNMRVFVNRMKNQLGELIANYKPAMLWFDGYWESPWTNEYGREVYDFIKNIDSRILVNNRLGKDYSSIYAAGAVGDFLTPEQQIGKLNMNEPWETCMTMGEQWSWKPNDKLKSTRQCIQTLVRTASGNGNLLFNIGPMADGRIEARQVTRLKEMGEWLKSYGESIYATLGGPFVPTETYGSTRKDNKIYVHVFERKENLLILPAIAGMTIEKAYFLNGPPVKFTQNARNITLGLPASLPNLNSNVIVLQTDTNTKGIKVLPS